MSTFRGVGLWLLLAFGCQNTLANAAPASDYWLLAKAQVSQLRNYSTLSPQQIELLEKKAVKWLVRINQLRDFDGQGLLPAHLLQLPTSLVYHTDNAREVNFVPGLRIAFVPNLELFYTVYYKYYSYLLKYRENTPLPEIILAMLNRESHFLWVVGDKGKSVGPCQLHDATARWLVEHPTQGERYRSLIYFDAKGMHHFRSQEAMVEFMFEFLLNTKNYAHGRELQGIAAYNGSLPSEEYTQTVVTQTVHYLALRVLQENYYAQVPLSRNELLGRIKKLLAQHIGQDATAGVLFEVAFRDAALYFEQQHGSAAGAAQAAMLEREETRISPGRGRVLAPDVSFGRPYVQKDPNVYIFSYFRENLDTTVFYHNKLMELQLGIKPHYSQGQLDTNFIYLYYEYTNQETQRRERKFIRSVQEYKNLDTHHTVMCNKESGKIYTIPRYPVYYEPQGGDKPTKAPSFFIDDAFLNTALRQFDF